MSTGEVTRAGQRLPDAFTTPAAMTIGGAARVPNTGRPTSVVATISISCTDAQDRTVNLEVETGIGTGVYNVIVPMRWNPNVSGIGVGITALINFVGSVEVPTGFGYRFTQSGTGTTAIVQLREQTI